MTTIRTVLKTVQLVSILGLITMGWFSSQSEWQTLAPSMWRGLLIAAVLSSVLIAGVRLRGEFDKAVYIFGLACSAGMILAVAVFAVQGWLNIPWSAVLVEVWRPLTVFGMLAAIVLTVRTHTGTEPQPQQVQQQSVMQR